MEITWMEFILLGLASFRLTRLIVYDKITGFLRAPFIDEVTVEEENGQAETYLVPKEEGIRRWIGELLTCHWCTGIWTALIIGVSFMTIPAITLPVTLILAIAGLAAIIETIIQQLIFD